MATSSRPGAQIRRVRIFVGVTKGTRRRKGEGRWLSIQDVENGCLAGGLAVV